MYFTLLNFVRLDESHLCSAFLFRGDSSCKDMLYVHTSLLVCRWSGYAINASRYLTAEKSCMYWQTLKCIFLAIWVAEKKEITPYAETLMNASTTLLVLEIKYLPDKCQTISICTQHLHIQLP